ncbi:class I SAM-dependent methyltransferase [Caenimonas koreensis]|uniref:class I SAM-dependent methyltransferase n=1 Tax=Caenimonas koreensis TaxID=367474 RepID=UPI003782EA28
MHGTQDASPWVQRWSHLLPAACDVLDVACGHGRHMKWFAPRGHRVTGVDRSQEAIAAVAGIGEAVQADIENGPWPFAGRTFGAVVVTNYLWRPLLPTLVASVAPGGVLIYETFAAGNETVGKPSRPDFLLQPGELLRAAATLQVVAYEDGFLASPDRFVQRLAAVRVELSQVDPQHSGGNHGGHSSAQAGRRRYTL